MGDILELVLECVYKPADGLLVGAVWEGVGVEITEKHIPVPSLYWILHSLANDEIDIQLDLRQRVFSASAKILSLLPKERENDKGFNECLALVKKNFECGEYRQE